jgi:predicted dehydrogenase
MGLRLGVIGAGSWANAAHLPALAARPEVEFVAVSRTGEPALRTVQQRYGFARASEDFRVVVDAGCDIVVVASPAAYHYEHAKAALAAGAHVLCEKPFTIEPQHARELVEVAQRHQRQLLVSFGWNYMPLVRRAKELVGEGGIGRLEQMSIAMSSQTRELLGTQGGYPDASTESAPEPATWTDPALSGGGYGQAQLAHALGLALHLVPVRVTEAFAWMSPAPDGAVELHDAIALRFDTGAVGTVSGGSAHLGAGGNKHALEVRAIGTDGQLLVDVERECVWLYRADGSDERLSLAPGDGGYVPAGPANALVDVALGRVEENRAPGALGVLTVEALDAAYRSAVSGKPEAVR